LIDWQIAVGDLTADLDKRIAASEGQDRSQQHRGPSTRAFALAQDDKKKMEFELRDLQK
jgi:hypothetical protein